ncbi:hypothetical protein, partial [Rathayibacter rathayi]|uniref:hypothetical protein n=1 Tax=Rathayibacter rathayi TaxID=33887 RepID=UPI001CA56336
LVGEPGLIGGEIGDPAAVEEWWLGRGWCDSQGIVRFAGRRPIRRASSDSQGIHAPSSIHPLSCFLTHAIPCTSHAIRSNTYDLQGHVRSAGLPALEPLEAA